MTRLQIIVDMNLSPDWATMLTQHGWPAAHWSSIGDPRADDSTIMAWARSNGFIVFTHDLDFGTTLALTHASGPSVLQVRGHNILPEHMFDAVAAALRQYAAALEAGALVVVEAGKSRVRVLPI